MWDDLLAFAKAVLRRWVFLMSGAVSTVISFVERIRHNPIANSIFIFAAMLCLFAACFQAWREEHRPTDSPVRGIKGLLTRGHACKVTPVIPHSVEELFTPALIVVDSVTLRSNRNQTEVRVPLSRVKELLPNGYKILVLDGRLQWVSRLRRWEFFPEAPKTEFGVPKVCGAQDSRVITLKKTFEEEGFRVYWRRLGTVAGTIAVGWEVVYDDDGRYFVFGDSDSEQVLMMGKS